MNPRSNTQIDHSPAMRDLDSRTFTAALIVGIALTVGIAGSSFWLSFAALRELAVMAGTDAGRAWVLPVVPDGAIIATTVIGLALSHHTDARTIRGRRFVFAVLIVAAGASILGNGYHATLTQNSVPAIVAAGIATVAPLFLLAMTEVLAVILRAPRKQRDFEAQADVAHGHRDVDAAGISPAGSFMEETSELAPAVWTTVLVYLENPTWAYADVAKERGVDPSVVSNHLAQWFDLQKKIAQLCGTGRPKDAIGQAASLAKRPSLSVLA